MRHALFVGIVSLIMLVVLKTSVFGEVTLPPVNLGETSFMDGVAYPGTLFQETFGFYQADEFKDHRGNKIPGDNEVTSVSAITHLAHFTKTRFFGGYYGFEMLIPVVNINVDTDFGIDDHETAVGDLIVSPLMLQWVEQKVFGKPFFHRLNFVFVLPTGKYDEDSQVNVGSNVLSFNPYYAFTIMPTPRLEVSARLHYLWNSENNDPHPAFNAGDIQPGEAFHANYAISYKVFEGMRIGLAGYVLQQLTDDRVDGHQQSNSKEQVYSLGPGIQFSRDDLTITLNSYFETDAENRPEGDRVILRFSKTF